MTFHVDDVHVDMPDKQRRSELAEFLRARRGVVVLLATRPKSEAKAAATTAWRIRGARKNWEMFSPPGHFDVAQVSYFGRTCLYIRYVGEHER